MSKKLVLYRKEAEFWKFLASKVSDLFFRHRLGEPEPALPTGIQGKRNVGW